MCCIPLRQFSLSLPSYSAAYLYVIISITIIYLVALTHIYIVQYTQYGKEEEEEETF